MKRNLFKILLLAVTVVLMMNLISCEDIISKIPFLSGDETPSGSEGGDDVDLEGLALVKNGVAQFQIVYTGEAGAEGIRAAQSFYEKLKGLGVVVDAPVVDTDASKVRDCEIIIGTGVRNRDEKYNVSKYHLGEEGYTMKVVDSKVILAGGTSSYTSKAVDNFIKYKLGIKAGVTEFAKNFAIEADYFYETLTKYLLESVAFNGIDLSEYTLVYDLDELAVYNAEAVNTIKKFRINLFDASGYYLNEGTVEEMDSYAHKFIIRTTDDAGENGFRAYIDSASGDFIVECAYVNSFVNAFEKFAKAQFYTKTGKVNLNGAHYSYSDNVSVVYYSDFGANGSDMKDDFEAIYNAHVFANECGQTVMGTANATYYIFASSFTKEIPVATDVDFKGATFIIDDTGSDAYKNRTLALFRTVREHEAVYYTGIEAVTEAFGNVSIAEGDTSIPWLADVIESKSLVRLYNSGHRDYIRHGSNQNSGSVRTEVVIINPDGTLAEDCPIRFDYTQVTDITIWDTNDTPISIGNATIYNICCRAVAETNFTVKYHAYNRGFRLERCNVTIHDITHQMLDEPELGWVQNPQTAYTQDKNKGSTQESYPYNRGLLYINQTYNNYIEDLIITGHTTYYEPKAGTASSNAGGTNYVAAGSYDYVVEHSTNIYFNNMKQVNGVYTLTDDGKIVQKAAPYALEDQSLWGIMSSNFAKNLFFEDCAISRIDAHQGYFNVSLIDTTIGHTFHAIGGGELYAENVHRISGANFLTLRSDYGGTFQGNVTIKNCSMEGLAGYSTNKGGYKPTTPSGSLRILETGYAEGDYEGYWDWDFGYTCYMPITLTMEGTFDYPAESSICMFNKDYTAYYDYIEANLDRIHQTVPTYVPYQVTKQVIFKDWKQAEIQLLATNYDPNNYMYRNVEIVRVSSDDE